MSQRITIVEGSDRITVVESGPQGAPGSGGGGGGATNLTWTAATSTVASDTGTDAVISAVDGTNPGLMTVAQSSKLAGIEAGADVTDAVNVEAAGALMDSEVDADIKTLVLPASTTISTFGRTLIDDADAAAARTTLGLGTAATTASTDYATSAQGTKADAALPRLAAGASVENVGSIEENVEVASVATTKAFDASTYGRAVYTMTANTTFSVTNPAPSGKATTFYWRIKGAFTPTLPASFDFVGGAAAAYVGTGEGTSYVATTEDGGTTYQVSVLAGWA